MKNNRRINVEPNRKNAKSAAEATFDRKNEKISRSIRGSTNDHIGKTDSISDINRSHNIREETIPVIMAVEYAQDRIFSAPCTHFSMWTSISE